MRAGWVADRAIGVSPSDASDQAVDLGDGGALLDAGAGDLKGHRPGHRAVVRLAEPRRHDALAWRRRAGVGGGAAARARRGCRRAVVPRAVGFLRAQKGM